MDKAQHSLQTAGHGWRGQLATRRAADRPAPRVAADRAMELVRLAALVALIFAPLIGHLAERRDRRAP
jgi:hypothetical protein